MSNFSNVTLVGIHSIIIHKQKCIKHYIRTLCHSIYLSSTSFTFHSHIPGSTIKPQLLFLFISLFFIQLYKVGKTKNVRKKIAIPTAKYKNVLCERKLTKWWKISKCFRHRTRSKWYCVYTSNILYRYLSIIIYIKNEIHIKNELKTTFVNLNKYNIIF